MAERSPFNAEILDAARAVLAAARPSGEMIATAESCTGGLVAGALTEIPGSSEVMDRGFITYADAAKTGVLGVDPKLIESHGAVSEPVARAMAEGALAHSDAHAAVAVTGIAGPGGGTADKPVGLVWFATARAGRTHAEVRRFGDIGRGRVRMEAVRVALALLLRAYD